MFHGNTPIVIFSVQTIQHSGLLSQMDLSCVNVAYHSKDITYSMVSGNVGFKDKGVGNLGTSHKYEVIIWD